jgi:hypothetical protein
MKTPDMNPASATLRFLGGFGVKRITRKPCPKPALAAR